jgi:hypothetical protein
MKKIITLSFALLFIFSTSSFAQSRANVVGAYEQRVYTGPSEVQESESDVYLKQDPQLSKVIWINNLIKGGRIKAVLNITGNGNGNFIYKIPAQIIGNYEIKFGCLIYNEEGTVTIGLNNKTTCMGLGGSKIDNVSVGKNGSVNVGDIAVNNDGNGSVKMPGVDVEGGNVNVNTKLLNEGIQYVGDKQGGAKAAAVEKDDDKDIEEVEVKTAPVKTKTKVRTTNNEATVEAGETTVDSNGNVSTNGTTVNSNGTIRTKGTTIRKNGTVKTNGTTIKSNGSIKTNGVNINTSGKKKVVQVGL